MAHSASKLHSREGIPSLRWIHYRYYQVCSRIWHSTWLKNVVQKCHRKRVPLAISLSSHCHPELAVPKQTCCGPSTWCTRCNLEARKPERIRYIVYGTAPSLRAAGIGGSGCWANLQLATGAPSTCSRITFTSSSPSAWRIP